MNAVVFATWPEGKLPALAAVNQNSRGGRTTFVQSLRLATTTELSCTAIHGVIAVSVDDVARHT